MLIITVRGAQQKTLDWQLIHLGRNRKKKEKKADLANGGSP